LRYYYCCTMTRSSPTHFTPTRLLALLLLGAVTVSSGVLAAPASSSMNSGPFLTGVARPEGLQSRSSLEQGSLLDVQRRGVEHVNLVPRAGDLWSTWQRLHNLMERGNLNQKEVEALNRDIDEVLKAERECLSKLDRPEVFGDLHKPEARQALFHTVRAISEDMREIVAGSVYVVGSHYVTSQEILQIARENYDRALSYFPEGTEKTHITKKMSEAQTVRRSYSFMFASPGGQRQ
ncbi:hypothetical protein F5880DRAFT_1601352, partial [Lentinula raphanica]